MTDFYCNNCQKWSHEDSWKNTGLLYECPRCSSVTNALTEIMSENDGYGVP